MYVHSNNIHSKADISAHEDNYRKKKHRYCSIQKYRVNKKDNSPKVIYTTQFSLWFEDLSINYRPAGANKLKKS